MSKVYEALKRLEAERLGRGNGNGNGRNGRSHWAGNGNGKGHRPVPLDFHLAPDVEEAYQRLGTNLLAVPTEAARPPQVLMVTAARHGEGTTTTTGIFASVLVRRRRTKTVVVEANFRSPACETVFSVKRNGGLGELVEGTQPLEAVVQPSQVQDLFVVTCGHTTLSPSTLFESEGMARAIEALRAEFDFVIFDCPPVNVYTDSSILGPKMDAGIMVVEADRTRIPEVQRAKRLLDRLGVNLLGVVLNRRKNVIPAFLEEVLL